jgi:hypothetical protein
LEIQLSRGESWDPIHNSITFLCLSQARIKFVSDLWQVGGFLRVLRIPPPMKLTATI